MEYTFARPAAKTSNVVGLGSGKRKATEAPSHSLVPLSTAVVMRLSYILILSNVTLLSVD
eukprot:TsM_000944700 transcript=TsM_000944700 gene=TsM_000944700